MTIGQWLNKAETALFASPDPAADAVWICEEVLGMSRGLMRISHERELNIKEVESLDAALARRISGEPVQYIFSRAPFMGFEFFVDKRVLIPRMDTETLCDEAVSYIKRKCPAARVLDMCAGSGAIGISIARLCPMTDVTLSDISASAGEVQRINAGDNHRIHILTGDMFATVTGQKFDVIVCNPPYIRSSEMSSLQSEVLREPENALDGGDDGLDFYRILANEAHDHLDAGGRLYMEIGFDQASDVCELFPGATVIKDLNGLDRVIRTEV